MSKPADVSLKPCPFCGGEASGNGMVRYSDGCVERGEVSQNEFYYCNCIKCGANNQGILGHLTRENAIAAWNTRPLEDAAHAAGKAEQREADAAVDEKSLDERMKAAGMISLSEMLENKPFTRFQIHSGMTDLEFFEAWLVRRHKEFATMRMGYELGDKDKDDELFQWVFAHCAVYSDVLMQFRAAIRDAS